MSVLVENFRGRDPRGAGGCREMSRGLRLHLVRSGAGDVRYEGTGEGLSLILCIDMAALGEDAVRGGKGDMLVCAG